MSRLKHFTRSLLSGYAVLATTTAFTLASIPLALSYLTKEQFGVWAVAAQIAGYMALVDLGMTGALARILIDSKDNPASSAYASMIVASLLVATLQALLVFALALVIGPVALSLAKIPWYLAGVFRALILWQGFIVATGLLTRIFSVILSAHHRFDLINYTQIVAAGVNFAVMWICFQTGKGVFALMYGQLAGICLVATLTLLGCVKLRLLPVCSAYRLPTRRQLSELFSFGTDVFGYSLGNQLINASQTLIITRVLGLDAGAVWSICTRTYSLLLQLIHRVFDYSISALSEMLVRDERHRLYERFRDLTVFSGTLAAVGGVIFAATNTGFITMWTRGNISWRVTYDVLLAVLGFVAVVQRAHTALLGARKHMSVVKYVYLGEGICFVVTAYFLAHSFGLVGILISSIACTCLFSLTYNLWQTRRFFSLPPGELLTWTFPALQCAAVLAPGALLLGLATSTLPASAAFAIRLAVLGLAAAFVTWRLGLPAHLKVEASRRLKMRLHRSHGNPGTHDADPDHNVHR